MKPIPLKRFVLEPSLVCNLKCKFCYHLHKYNEWHSTIKPFEKVCNEIDDAILRGNNYMDVTGGEPTIYPHIIDTVLYAKEKGIKTCIITNGIVNSSRAEGIMKAGLNDWLVSRHGLENTHNKITNNPNGYTQQVRFLNQIKPMRMRFNCVISKFNQHEIFDIAKEISEFNPRIVNFIHFNPHHSWKDDIDGTKQVIADLNIVEPLLNKAIFYLESCGIGVNVRYYPMCKINPYYRRCVCNDLHVMFDPYEWDYNTSPKTIDNYYQWGVNTSNANEEKGEPCCSCDLQNVCGGMNKYAHASNTSIYGEQLTSQINQIAKKEGFYYYRGEQIITLQER